jgi:hypothetical protein
MHMTNIPNYKNFYCLKFNYCYDIKFLGYLVERIQCYYPKNQNSNSYNQTLAEQLKIKVITSLQK